MLASIVDVMFVVFLVCWPAAPIVSYLLARRLEEMANEMHQKLAAPLVGAASPRAVQWG